MVKLKKFAAAVCSLAMVCSLGLSAVKADTDTETAAETAAETTAAPEATAEASAAPESTAEASAAPESTAEASAAPESTAEASAAPEATAEATAAPEATAEATSVPAEVETPGIVLTLDEQNSTALKKVIIASYTGFKDGIASYQLEMNMPSDKVSEVSVESCFDKTESNYITEKDYYVLLDYTIDNEKPDNNILAIITLVLNSELTENVTLTLQGDSMIADTDAMGVALRDGSMDAASVVLSKTAETASEATETDVSPVPTTVPIPTAAPNNSGSSAGNKGTISSGTVINGGSNTAVPQETVELTDLDQAEWAIPAITALVAKGAVNGYEDGTFRPNQSITRAEFTKMLMSAFGINIPDTAVSETVFTDVNEEDWFYAYVYYGSKLGIVNGYEDGSFKPNNPVTRQEMATVVYRMANTAKVNLAAVNEAKIFDDADQIGDWAAEAVSALQQAGVVNGTTDTAFEPAATATRAQVAQIIYNVDQLR